MSGVLSPAGTSGLLPSADLIYDRARGAYYGLLIADALSMPAHWYYNPNDIVRDFGRLKEFQPPKVRHPSSIMSLSNTGGAGRGAQEGTIIGDVINHGKKQFWGVPNMHYHRGMSAGENTLNAVVARLLVRTISSDASLPASLVNGAAYSPAKFLEAYLAFMTTPGSHNDTYAESWLRMFFSNWKRGKPLDECADDDRHNIDSAGGLVLLPAPVLLATAAAAGRGAAVSARVAAETAVVQQLATHKSQRLASFSKVYASALSQVFLSPDAQDVAGSLQRAVIEAGTLLGADLGRLVTNNPGTERDTSVIGGGGAFTSACYIEGSLPALLYLAAKYADRPAEALIANTNVGGENCHRGSALGALIGAAHGMAAWKGTGWVESLADGAAIDREAHAFAAAVREAYALSTKASE